MKLFKENKKQPIKFRNYKYIGESKEHPNVCYYFKELPRDNFYLMTCSLEGKQRKPEIGAGTNVKVIDLFMAHHLYDIRHNRIHIDNHSFIAEAVDKTFIDSKNSVKEEMIKKYTSAIPKDIKVFDSYKNAKKENYNLLYCSNDETKDRVFGIVKVVLTKDITIEKEALNIHNTYTLFKFLEFRVSPKYIKGISKDKYIQTFSEDISINHNLLI